MRRFLTISGMLLTGLLHAQTQVDFEKELLVPKRIVSGVTVNITPLVNWQMTGSQESRPLKPWEFISGPVTGTNSIGWMVQASIGEAGAPTTIALRNPPRVQQEEFNRLVARYAALQRRQKWLVAEHQRASERYRAIENEYRRQQFFRFSGDSLDVAADVVSDLERDHADVGKQIEGFDWKGHDPDRGFIFKGYALRTGLLYRDAPIFDYGQPLR